MSPAPATSPLRLASLPFTGLTRMRVTVQATRPRTTRGAGLATDPTRSGYSEISRPAYLHSRRSRAARSRIGGSASRPEWPVVWRVGGSGGHEGARNQLRTVSSRQGQLESDTGNDRHGARLREAERDANEDRPARQSHKCGQ